MALEPIDHDVQIGIGIIKQVVQNRSHPLDVIREALSNSCAKQVQAANVWVTIFYDGTYGWSFEIRDDGIGMDYTGAKEPEKKGRLDRFLDLAYSGSAGLEADEFGFKGLGSKLMYLSKKIEISTKTSSGLSFKAEIHDPMGKLLKEKPEKPKPQVYKLPSDSLEFPHGTIIRLYGYDSGRKYPEYEDSDKLKRYLYFRTVVGCTKPERLGAGFPKIIVKTPDLEGGEEMKVGFPWIRKEGTHVDNQKIGIIEPNIQVPLSDKSGVSVTLTLKGGYARQTAEFPWLTGDTFDAGVGLVYSWKGVPYFNLDFNEYKPDGFELYYRFCRFVVECDDVDTDMARGKIVADGLRDQLFTKALREAFRRVPDSSDYKDWVRWRREVKRKELGQTLNDRKDELLSKTQRWVYVNDKITHKEPTNEHDTLALLWKLEGMGKLPFHAFRTLEHTAQRGIDIIADFQEEDFSEKKLFQAVEVEHLLENYDDHDHNPEQTSLVIAWDAKDKTKLTNAKGNWKYVWGHAGANLNVVLLRYIPGLEVK